MVFLEKFLLKETVGWQVQYFVHNKLILKDETKLNKKLERNYKEECIKKIAAKNLFKNEDRLKINIRRKY